MTYNDRIAADPAICGGQPVIRGTRVLVRTVLGYLAHGAQASEIVAEFPTITDEDVRAVIAFAAASVSEDLPPPSPITRHQGSVKLKLDENLPRSAKARLTHAESWARCFVVATPNNVRVLRPPVSS
jgi:uncharacterized protein (DUF433 family)